MYFLHLSPSSFLQSSCPFSSSSSLFSLLFNALQSSFPTPCAYPKASQALNQLIFYYIYVPSILQVRVQWIFYSYTFTPTLWGSYETVIVPTSHTERLICKICFWPLQSYLLIILYWHYIAPLVFLWPTQQYSLYHPLFPPLSAISVLSGWSVLFPFAISAQWHYY